MLFTLSTQWLTKKVPLLTCSGIFEPGGNFIIFAMRIVMAASALLVSHLGASTASPNLSRLQFVLALYMAYCGFIFLLSQSRSHFIQDLRSWTDWVDAGCYTVLIVLSYGSESFFFVALFFFILLAFIRRGHYIGLGITVGSALFLMIIGHAIMIKKLNSELDRFLLSSIYLLTLGYVGAYYGSLQRVLTRRLDLLREINSISNPRFGVDRTLNSILERLRSFYTADTCLLIMADPATGKYSLRHADRADSESGANAEPVAEELARLLVSIPSEYALLYRRKARWWLTQTDNIEIHELKTGNQLVNDGVETDQLVSTLDVQSFISIPLDNAHKATGRLYLLSQQRVFHDSDVGFLHQVIQHVLPLIDNIRLVDRLASDAAEEERRRIARDIHDSIIQPYIGLQFGLTGIQRKLAKGSVDVRGDIDRLIEVTSVGIADLRSYVSGLKENSERGSNLVSAVRRFAAKFSVATGINVQVEAQKDIRVSDRLAAEVFQMVAEGLSNVRRHTHAESVITSLGCENGQLFLRIKNDRANGMGSSPFTPRSISERASSLGGQTRVEHWGDDGTAVVVEIPL